MYVKTTTATKTKTKTNKQTKTTTTAKRSCSQLIFLAYIAYKRTQTNKQTINKTKTYTQKNKKAS